MLFDTQIKPTFARRFLFFSNLCLSVRGLTQLSLSPHSKWYCPLLCVPLDFRALPIAEKNPKPNTLLHSETRNNHEIITNNLNPNSFIK